MAHRENNLLVGRNSKQGQYIPNGRGGQVNWMLLDKLVCYTYIFFFGLLSLARMPRGLPQAGFTKIRG
jgi:hypothetical protein